MTEPNGDTPRSFTGITRRRKTRLAVKISDRFMRGLISVGGIGTIVAVCGIMIFLVAVVAPLFRESEVKDEHVFSRAGPGRGTRLVDLKIDEHQVIGWALYSDGTLVVREEKTGSVLETRPLFPDAVPTASSISPTHDDVAFGFEDGTLVLGRISFTSRILDRDVMISELEAPAEVLDLEPGGVAAFGKNVVEMTPERQYRVKRVDVEFDDPTRIDPPSPVRLLDQTFQHNQSTIAVLTEDRRIVVKEVRRRPNLLTGKTTIRLTGSEFPLEHRAGADEAFPAFLRLGGLASHLYLVWSDGRLVRVNVTKIREPVQAEIVDLTPERDVEITSFELLIGKTTFIVGDTAGRLSAWFPFQPDDAETVDGTMLVKAHVLRDSESTAGVTALRSSARSRLVAAGYTDGTVRLWQVTTESLVNSLVARKAEAVQATAIAPRDDGVIAATATAVCRWQIDAEHPDITLSTLFTRIWYESAEGPKHTWQSTGGDEFEPKLGLVPLVFGTIKATLYSMLFGLPLAILAAIFASEFLHPRLKMKIKPTIEIMASLPSVVLGFLAALVIAPFVEDVVPAVLTAFLTIPFSFLLGAYLWQLIPHETALRLMRWRFPAMFLCVPFGILLAALLGPVVQTALFAGDLKAWLDGQVGSGLGGWVYLLLPVAALLTALVIGRGFGPRLRALSANWGRRECARLDLVKFGGGILGTILVALVLAGIFTWVFGWDPRGSVVGTYVQRNALIVGFVMGFAIIPIIFTIAEDALSAVPEHLRSASLGAGATPWQTATRVIVPTAMSGLFSATMIGLGRAVGETMIVLMATGNTPIMDWNIFNGFRTLAACLAYELPEAVVGSTHYRTLFFAGLVLFLMTFVVNTVAEIVRLRFRKRSYQL